MRRAGTSKRVKGPYECMKGPSEQPKEPLSPDDNQGDPELLWVPERMVGPSEVMATEDPCF